jgi:hypothetical protein
MQSSLAPNTRGTVPALLAAAKRSDVLLFLVIFVTVFSITPLLVWGGATIGFQYLLGVLAALAAAALVVRWPLAGLYIVAGCVVLVEEEPLATPIFTDQLDIFHWPASLTGLPERPIGFLLLLMLFVLIGHRLLKRQRVLWGGPLLLPFIGFLLCVAWGVIHGLQSGGDFKIIVLEVRPFWYLFVAYLLAYNLLSQKRQIRALFWLIILGAGVKGLQGVYIYLIVLHGNLTNSHEIMAHEESFFFIAVLLLLVLFALHHRYRPQFYAILLISPAVLIALVANQRRADYLALLIGVVVAWAFVFLLKPQARKKLALGMVLAVILVTGYVLAFSHSSGSLAEPARGIVSIFSSNENDPVSAASNLYRSIENADLKYTMKQDPLLGWGFGRPFLQPVPLPNILSLDPYYLYIPHNTIYWVWMRLGDIGYALLWYLFGAIIVRGSLIARRLRDPYLQVVAIFVVTVTVMEIIVAYADYQLFFFRNVLYLGLLLGVLMRLPALDEAEGKEQPACENTRRLRNITASPLGSQRA